MNNFGQNIMGLNNAGFSNFGFRNNGINNIGFNNVAMPGRANTGFGTPFNNNNAAPLELARTCAGLGAFPFGLRGGPGPLSPQTICGSSFAYNPTVPRRFVSGLGR